MINVQESVCVRAQHCFTTFAPPLALVADGLGALTMPPIWAESRADQTLREHYSPLAVNDGMHCFRSSSTFSTMVWMTCSPSTGTGTAMPRSCRIFCALRMSTSRCHMVVVVKSATVERRRPHANYHDRIRLGEKWALTR
jgi:hypothetical protein